MVFAIERLNRSIGATLVAHFLALPLADRCLRFCTALTPAAIAAYVRRIDFDRDAVLGAYDDDRLLVGVAHVAVEAEVALSVVADRRGRGIGSELFRRAVRHAHCRRAPKIFMHFLAANTPILRIAHKFGMVVVEEMGEADAYLDLQSSLPASIGATAEGRAFAPLDSAGLCVKSGGHGDMGRAA